MLLVLRYMPLFRKAVNKDSLVSMQPVLSLIENDALRTVYDFLSYLIASVSREAVHEDGVLVSNAHELAVDLIILEDLDSLRTDLLS